MRIVIEKVENGFLVVVETDKGRRVLISDTASNVVDFVKSLIDPSPIQLPTDKPLALV